MSRKLDWSRAKEPRGPAHDYYARPDRTAKFAKTYARYANSERAAGRTPLPPLIWIKSLRKGGARKVH